MVENNDHPTNPAEDRGTSVAESSEQEFFVKAVKEPRWAEFRNNEGRIAALLPTSQNQAQAPIPAPLRISTTTSQSEVVGAQPSPVLQVPGAWPKSASSARNPGHLDGNGDTIAEDRIQSATGGSPLPSLRTAFQQHSSGRWLEGQDTEQQGEIEHNIREINRVLAQMVMVQQAIQQELKEMTEAISAMVEIVEQVADIAEDRAKEEGEKELTEAEDEEVKAS